MLSFTDEAAAQEKPIYSDSEEEMNLDLPMVTKKNKTLNRILSDEETVENNSESSNNESDNSNNSDSSNNDSGSFSDSSNEESSQQKHQKQKKNTSPKPTKNQFLSTAWIVDSDSDDGGADHDPSKPLPSSSPIVIKKKNKSNSKTPKSPKSSFKKASEDFKSTLKLMSYNSDDSEEDDMSSDGNEADSDDVKATLSESKVRKPKETLKNVLKESEALLRRVDPVELPVDVLKPKSLTLILSEALATNSRSPIEARKRVIEEKRKLQRTRMEKLLGSERMAQLSHDVPKIGQFKLDEAVEIDVQVFDEKATEGNEEMIIEKVKVKLVDLPDKHFKSCSQNNTPSNLNEVAGYKVHLQSQKKASIETLNRQLQEKIEAQGNAFMAHQQRAREADMAAKRTLAAKKEHLRRVKEAKKEKELRERREKKAEGGELFASEKYKGVDRPSEDQILDVKEPVVSIVDVDGVGLVCGKRTAKIILSDDSEAELLNLNSEPETETEPEKQNSLSGLLSGKFETESETDMSDISEADSDRTVNSLNSDLPDVNFAMEEVSKKQQEEAAIKESSIGHQRKQSAFIDDEASDEDEEREAEDIDEVALQEEMARSKFIASEDESENDAADDFELVKFVNEKRMREDEEITRKMFERYGRHIEEDSQDVDMFNVLGNKYGLVNNVVKSVRNTDLVDEDDELRKLLLEQKKRKIEALGPRVIKRIELSEDEEEQFKFKSSQRGGYSSLVSSDNEFYAQESSSEIDSDSGSDSYYEREESGLQSKVNEQVDPEEEQVQAAVDLDRRLATMNILKPTESIQTATLIKATDIKRVAALSVPKGDAKLKTRLMALQGENDDIGNNSGGGGERSKVFKGFVSSNSGNNKK